MTSKGKSPRNRYKTNQPKPHTIQSAQTTHHPTHTNNNGPTPHIYPNRAPNVYTNHPNTQPKTPAPTSFPTTPTRAIPDIMFKTCVLDDDALQICEKTYGM